MRSVGLSSAATSLLRVVGAVGAIAVMTLSAGAGHGAAEAELRAFLAAIGGQDAAARGEAMQRASDMGAAAVFGLGELLTSEDPSVSRGAKVALESIAAHAARPGADDERVAVGRALVELLGADLTSSGRATVIRQLGLVGREHAVGALYRLLSDPELAEPARQAIQRIPGRRATEALLAALPHAPEKLKCGLIFALGSRRDVEAVPVLIALARDRNMAVRLAAVDVLGRIGDARAAGAIATAAMYGPDRQRRVAIDAALRLADVEMARANEAPARAIYEGALTMAMTTSQRLAALKGMRQLGDPRSLPTVLRTLGDPDSVFQRMAMTLIDELAGERAVAAMTGALDMAGPQAKAALLRGIADRQAGDAVPMLLEALKDRSDVVKIAAASALGDFGGIHNAPPLLEVAEHGSASVRPMALNSYLRLLEAELWDERPPSLIPLYNRALQLATREAECRLALTGVAEFADPSSLPLVEALTTRGGIRQEALAAYVAIGRTLAAQGKPERAIEVFRNAVRRGASRNLANECVRELRKLGVEGDFAREAGFVTDWWLIGTFPSPNKRAFDADLPPERAVNLDAEVQWDGRTLRWRPFRSADIQGVVDLVPLFDRHEDVAICAYAEVAVGADTDVIFKIGSDDGVVCRLNGKRIHANNASRPLRVDEDAASATLKAGTNTILLKILQGRGGWAFCLRIADADGQPLQFGQRGVPVKE